VTHFSFQASPTLRLSSLKLALGEEARPIIFKAVGSDDNVHTAFFAQDPPLLFVDETEASYDASNSYRLLSVVARSAGSGRFTAYDVPRRGEWRVIDQFTVEVGPTAATSADLLYTGRYLGWHRSLPASFNGVPRLFVATSGLEGHQRARDQKSKDHGPLPEGIYSLVASIDSKQASVEAANARGEKSIKNHEEGIQFLRIGGAGPVDRQWGTLRVRLTPQRGNMHSRGGFYLHNSHKGFSHGCIEVGSSPDGVDFFSALLGYVRQRSHKATLTLEVKYSHPEQSTLGRTKW
jgi:hypothetical protein